MDIGERCSVLPPEPPSTVHAILRLKSVAFAGNHAVEQDTTGYFTPSEWQRGRTRQWPICYTRGQHVRLTARFDVVVKPTATETLTIRGRLEFGGSALEWDGRCSCGPGDTEVSTGELTSSGPLPNEVRCVDSADIEFFASGPEVPFYSTGVSRNVLYVTLGDPQGTPPYWTLLDISCRAASGATTPGQVVEKSFVPFTTRSLTRKRDGRGLTYWNPDTTTATNTQKLLASSDGSGQCGSWSEFLIDMYKVHGISASEKVLIVRSLSEWQSEAAGFLVKNWQFVGSGSQPPPFTHVMWSECVKEPGVPGQGNPNPPPAFFNHFIVRSFGKFYDPSYGGGPITDQTRWEVGAIDGLFSDRNAGYPKSTNPTTNLVRFFNAATLSPL